MTDEARRVKYILKLLEHFYFYIFTFYISYTRVECGKDVMSYFASSSSLCDAFRDNCMCLRPIPARVKSETLLNLQNIA